MSHGPFIAGLVGANLQIPTRIPKRYFSKGHSPHKWPEHFSCDLFFLVEFIPQKIVAIFSNKSTKGGEVPRRILKGLVFLVSYFPSENHKFVTKFNWKSMAC